MADAPRPSPTGPLSRRALLAGLAVALARPAGAAAPGTAALQAGIDEAARAGRPFRLPPGTTPSAGLRLPDGAHLVGAPGRSVLALAGEGPLLALPGGARVTLEGIVLDGLDRPLPAGRALLEARGVADLRIGDVELRRSGGDGLRLVACGGRVAGSRVLAVRRAGLFALDSAGLSIEGNRVEGCGENGVLVWRSAKGRDGTRVAGNTIRSVRADPGGTGEWGNGVGVFRAGDVMVEGNRMEGCAYSAARVNGGDGAVIRGNGARALGEAAIFVEFEAVGAVVAANVIEDAMEGIKCVNLVPHGGRLAAVTGNVVRGLRRGRHPGDGTEAHGGVGVQVEGDAAVSGNAVEGAPRCALRLGWGPALREAAAHGNVLRDCGVGVEVSVAPGAGSATVTGNSIRARGAAVVGMAWDRAATGDLARGAPGDPRVRVEGNALG